MLKKLRQSLVVVGFSLLAPFVFAASQININTADALTIAENLNGIGEKKAQAIIEYRDLHGQFRSADDLVKVKGIGFKLLERNSALISFGQAADSTASVTTSATTSPSVDNTSSGTLAPSN
ncbi:MAG: ComEA family DNA-binding protein [Pseudomonadota bacterium]